MLSIEFFVFILLIFFFVCLFIITRVSSANEKKRKKQIKDLKQQILQYKNQLQIYSEKQVKLEKELQYIKEQYETQLRLSNELENQNCNLNSRLKEATDRNHALISDPNSVFKLVSSLVADYSILEYETSASYLEQKKPSAPKEAKRIRELKADTREYIQKYKYYKYCLEYLYSLFPDLEDISEETEDISVSSTDFSFNDGINWETLSSVQKSNILLDNYLKRSKSNWEIGRDYELFVGYRYSQLGYFVDYNGSNYGLHDLGRDLIVSKNGEIAIVQCKYWSLKKQIHEKHIMQLFGTVAGYCIEHHMSNSLVHGIFITNITLSDTAKKFADFLDIKYKENFFMGDFPCIKCNIGKDDFGLETKLYHLPTDQQYDKVKIVNPGECFVFTPEEAESLGFRHAYRWRH
ncbi:restriction endonuclease [[Clostridium] symbiosum]|uniref:restriction endonuclease n=1 Tax=Clostridium symbiosum TaxID=1512 RepID=UPI0034A43EE3